MSARSPVLGSSCSSSVLSASCCMIPHIKSSHFTDHTVIWRYVIRDVESAFNYSRIRVNLMNFAFNLGCVLKVLDLHSPCWIPFLITFAVLYNFPRDVLLYCNWQYTNERCPQLCSAAHCNISPLFVHRQNLLFLVWHHFHLLACKY